MTPPPTADGNQFACDGVFISNSVVVGARGGIGQHVALQGLHASASNRLRVVSIAARSVVGVFFTKACNTNSVRPWTATYTAQAGRHQGAVSPAPTFCGSGWDAGKDA
jgi:hypothetical protein